MLCYSTQSWLFNTEFYTRLYYERDAAYLSLIDSFLQDSPQLLLQSYILLTRDSQVQNLIIISSSSHRVAVILLFRSYLIPLFRSYLILLFRSYLITLFRSYLIFLFRSYLILLFWSYLIILFRSYLIFLFRSYPIL